MSDLFGLKWIKDSLHGWNEMGCLWQQLNETYVQQLQKIVTVWAVQVNVFAHRSVLLCQNKFL